MRSLIAIIALILAPGLGMSQGAPGTNISLDVGVTALSMRGDITEVRYVLRNRPSSAERLAQFTVNAPSPVLRIWAPEPRQSWFTSVNYRTRPVALWAALDQQVLPGQESQPLVFEAVGLPAIVTYWVQGYYPPSADIPSDTLPLGDPLVENGVPGITVGVEPFPSDRSPANLLVRLLGLADRSCSLGWITNATVCTWLRGKLDAATQAIRQGNWAGARTELQSCLSKLEEEHRPGLPVNDSAYWLLKVNAAYILARL